MKPLAILALVVCGCQPQYEEKPPPRTVKALVVSKTQGTQERAFSGHAQARFESRLSFKVPGTLEMLAVRSGDTVAEGELLATLDPIDFDLQVQEAYAALTRAKAGARNHQTNYERVQALYETRSASRTELDAARAASESGEALVREATNRLYLVERQRSYTELLAPYAASIAEVYVDVNENVGSGTPVIRLTSNDQIEVVISVPEKVIDQIEKGQRTLVSFPALPGRQFNGVVEEIGAATSLTSTTFPVTIGVEVGKERVRPGMAADVNLTFPSDGQAHIILPSVAVGEDVDGRFVFLVSQDEEGAPIIRKQVVRIGAIDDNGVEIVRGLIPGDRVAIAGLRSLKDGQEVRVD